MNSSTQHDYKICSKESPMPKIRPEGQRWIHSGAKPTDKEEYSRMGNREEYKCPHCGLEFWVTLPDY